MLKNNIDTLLFLAVVWFLASTSIAAPMLQRAVQLRTLQHSDNAAVSASTATASSSSDNPTHLRYEVNVPVTYLNDLITALGNEGLAAK